MEDELKTTSSEITRTALINHRSSLMPTSPHRARKTLVCTLVRVGSTTLTSALG